MEQVYDSNPGLRYTSSHVFDVYNQGSKESAVSMPVFDCGAVFDPFYTNGQQNVAEVSRIPIVCIRCASYLNAYSFVLNDTGEWVCPLCKSVNPSFCQALPSAYGSNTGAVGYGFGQPEGVNSQQSRNAQLCDAFAELRSSHCDFYEDVAPSTFSVGTSGKSSRNTVGCFIFALDVELCSDMHVVDMLCNGITSMPELTEICVVLYGRHIYALRLGGGLLSSGNPLVSDVIPGSNDRTELYAHLISRGSYGVPAGILKNHVEVLRQGLTTFALSTDAAPLSAHHALSNQVQCTLDALVAFAVALGTVYSSNQADAAPMSRLSLLSSRSLSCRGALSTSSLKKNVNTPATAAETLSLYSTLGTWAYTNYCSIDVFNASLRAANLDQLDALVGPSGGSVVTGSAYSDIHMCASFESFLKRSTGHNNNSYSAAATGSMEILHSVMPTLEIRTCSKLSVDRIVGPIVSAADVVLYNTHSKDKGNSRSNGNDEGKLSPNEAGLAIDSAHLAHSVYYLEQQNSTKGNNSSTNSLFGGNETPVAKLYSELVRRNQRDVVISGINMRHTATTATTSAKTTHKPAASVEAVASVASHAAVSVQFKVSNEKNTTDSLYSKGNALIGKVGADTHNIVQNNQFAFVQMVVRFVVKRIVPGSSAPVTQKVTRIYTQRLSLTTDRDEYMRSLDPSLWALVVSRGLVADHHTTCMRSFGGAIRNQLDQEGRYAFEALRADAVRSVDELVAAVTQHWPHSTSFSQEKVLRACRLLFQLREGPLLDGPSADHTEAYLLRSTFLKADYAQALRLLMPALTIHAAVSNLSTDEAVATTTTTQAPPLAALSVQYPPPASAPTPSSVLMHAPPSTAPIFTQPSPPASMYAPPPGPPPSSSSIQALYPPPSLPPPSSSIGGPVIGAPPVGVSNTLLFPPPPTPPPSTATAFPFPTPASNIASSPGTLPSTAQRNTDGVSLSIAPDSVGLLPGTIAVLDCGDRIIVRKNALRNTSTAQQTSVLPGGSTAAGKLALEVNDLFDEATQALLIRLEKEVNAMAARRYPVPSVFVLPRAGTPQDRMLYCRLMPTHTDTRESLHAMLLNNPEVPPLLSVDNQSNLLTADGSIAHTVQRNSAWRRLTHGLSVQDIDDFLAPLPYTDQPFFAKYLSAVAPGQAGKLLSKVASPVEETRRAAPVSMHMDRGPAAVFAPPMPPSSHSAKLAAFTSSDDIPL